MVNVGISYKTVEKGLHKALQTPSLVYNLVGYSGIGKTAIVRQVVSELGGKVVEINSSLLQAGDLAMPVKHEDADNNPIVKYVVNEIITGINKEAKDNKSQLFVLFFDEFNRADAEVQSDLMNLILQRQLFDVVLEDNVRVVTAQNPDRTTEGFEHTNYDVHEVDEATASRVVDIRMRYSAMDWLEFGKTYNVKRERYNVHPMVTAYISNGNEDKLLVFNPDKRNTPSPRSWTRVGDLLYDMQVEDLKDTDGDLINFIHESIVGTVGGDSAESFMSFAETFTSYIRLEDWLSAKGEDFDKLLGQYEKYDNTKRAFMVEALIEYFVENKDNAQDKELATKVASVLNKAPMDTIASQLKFIARKLTELFRGETMEVTLKGDDGVDTRAEVLTKGMVLYINFVKSNHELSVKQKESLFNNKVETDKSIVKDLDEAQGF